MRQPKMGGTTDIAFVPDRDERVLILSADDPKEARDV